MVGYNPENKTLCLDPVEAEWVRFGFACGALIRSPLRSVVLDACVKFDTAAPSNIFGAEQYAGQGHSVELPATVGMVEAIQTALNNYRVKNIVPRRDALSTATTTPIKTMTNIEYAQVMMSISQVISISGRLGID